MERGFPKTEIVKKTVEDFKAVANDILGISKNLGQGQPPVPGDHTFGVTTAGDHQWNAAKCIHGEPIGREVEPDNDLGLCVKKNCTNKVWKKEDENRTFGVPTIRMDIPFKEKKSVADHQNYGDEPEVIDILFPNTFTELGVSEFDF